MFQLAHDLGKTVGELSDMTAKEFAYWMAFYEHRNKQHEEMIKKHKK